MSTMRKSNSEFRKLDTDLMSLRALVAVVEEASFSRAALRIGRSQSAVSLQVKKLETRLQAQLLNRSSHSVSPTVAGELLISYSKRILALSDEAFLAIAAPETSRPLSIGFAEYLAPKQLPEILGAFRRAHSATPINLKLGQREYLHRLYEDGEVDVVVSGPQGEGGELLRTEKMVWVGAEPTKFQTGEPLPLVVMSTNCIYRKVVLESLAAHNRSWEIAVEANSISGVRMSIAAGFGVSAMAQSAVTPDLLVLNNFPKLPKTLICIYISENDPHPLANRLVSYLNHAIFHKDHRAEPRL